MARQHLASAHPPPPLPSPFPPLQHLSPAHPFGRPHSHLQVIIHAHTPLFLLNKKREAFSYSLFMQSDTHIARVPFQAQMALGIKITVMHESVLKTTDLVTQLLQ